MIKKFFLKQAAKLGTKNLPKEQQEVIMKLMEQKPELFETIAKDIKTLTDGGMPETYAAFEIMKKYQKQLQEAVVSSGLSEDQLKKMAQVAEKE